MGVFSALAKTRNFPWRSIVPFTCLVLLSSKPFKYKIRNQCMDDILGLYNTTETGNHECSLRGLFLFVQNLFYFIREFYWERIQNLICVTESMSLLPIPDDQTAMLISIIFWGMLISCDPLFCLKVATVH